MRPTNGEISVTPASAQATAWAKLNSSVRLQWMPSRSSCSAARMPSQVLAILMRTRSRPIPAFCVQADQPAGLGQGPLGVEAQPGIDLGGHPAGDDLEDLAAEVDEQLVHERLGAGGPVAGGLQGVLEGVVQRGAGTAASGPPGRAATGWWSRPAACARRWPRCRRCRPRPWCSASRSRAGSWWLLPCPGRVIVAEFGRCRQRCSAAIVVRACRCLARWWTTAACPAPVPTGETPRGTRRRCHPAESPEGAASASWRSRRRGPRRRA